MAKLKALMILGTKQPELKTVRLKQQVASRVVLFLQQQQRQQQPQLRLQPQT